MISFVKLTKIEMNEIKQQIKMAAESAENIPSEEKILYGKLVRLALDRTKNADEKVEELLNIATKFGEEVPEEEAAKANIKIAFTICNKLLKYYDREILPKIISPRVKKLFVEGEKIIVNVFEFLKKSEQERNAIIDDLLGNLDLFDIVEIVTINQKLQEKADELMSEQINVKDLVNQFFAQPNKQTDVNRVD
ncbi:hypothetical protein WR25_26951 [Diploscapter pachys]|uniref:Uncharacterized protein n=1 Tax=Diploscapter pachys TaxID=2018661 RepID=A0A2A2LNI7_9BILA|nr:hypothetical protein WR25_26951 [Diploscapter pachys]